MTAQAGLRAAGSEPTGLLATRRKGPGGLIPPSDGRVTAHVREAGSCLLSPAAAVANALEPGSENKHSLAGLGVRHGTLGQDQASGAALSWRRQGRTRSCGCRAEVPPPRRPRAAPESWRPLHAPGPSSAASSPVSLTQSSAFFSFYGSAVDLQCSVNCWYEVILYIQDHTCVTFRLSSIMVYYRILSVAPCAIEKILLIPNS